MCDGSGNEHSHLLIQVQQPAGVGSELTVIVVFIIFWSIWPTLRKETTENNIAIFSFFSCLAEANFTLTENTDKINKCDFLKITGISLLFF